MELLLVRLPLELVNLFKLTCLPAELLSYQCSKIASYASQVRLGRMPGSSSIGLEERAKWDRVNGNSDSSHVQGHTDHSILGPTSEVASPLETYSWPDSVSVGPERDLRQRSLSQARSCSLPAFPAALHRKIIGAFVSTLSRSQSWSLRLKIAGLSPVNLH
jgi:hypothetical protein